MSTDWTTRLMPEFTSRHGVEEIHSVVLVPKGWPGKGQAVTLLIPECEMQVCIPAKNDGAAPTVLINPPVQNKNVKHWLHCVCETARESGAAVHIACDTNEQAQRAAKQASRLLPNHERVALERMYQADTRCRSNLN